MYLGVFCLLFAYAAIVYIQSRLTKAEFRHFFFLAIVGAAGVVFLTVIGLTYAGELIMLASFMYLCFFCKKILLSFLTKFGEHWLQPKLMEIS